ncbi:ABC transporter permease [Telmatospirillum sp. J64-1]|uniref:cell division protein FtsX n=1 Tax=Telmatospirillum sp. J64-1 TaxID=2502183 RepID=UPI00115E6E29|nr:FtsX-like permease family protein [Telmatospirillum sp. J64-1]
MLFFRRRSDLPLKDDATSRFLPWLVALMTFLSAVSLAGVFVLGGVIERWDRDVSGTLTVQVAPAPGNAVDSEVRTRERVEAAVRLLRSTPGVLSAHSIDKTRTLQLLEPWLGDTALLQDLPLPLLIDVTVDPSKRVDLDALSETLKASVPGATLDDHRVWLSRLVNLSRTVEMLALSVVLMIGGVTSATVIYATRTGLAVHQEVINVLHMIGAQDSYIARQFAERAFNLGLAGGLLGLALAAPALGMVGWAARRLEGGLLPDLSMPWTGWVMLLVLPWIAALLAMVTARFTVLRSLARMP